MKSTLIKDTTKSERIELVKQWEERSMQHSQQDTFLKFLMIIQA